MGFFGWVFLILFAAKVFGFTTISWWVVGFPLLFTGIFSFISVFFAVYAAYKAKQGTYK